MCFAMAACLTSLRGPRVPRRALTARRRAASVPPYAIGPALITVGALMMLNVVRIKWEQTAEALPAFLTIIIMPATFSIAYGAVPRERV
jgi:xanthine/uracil/vitamin C permease (AzgA family)